MADKQNIRQKLGCWLHERWRTELVLRSPVLASHLGLSWIDLCNRSEAVQHDSISNGRVCPWSDSSPLTVSRVFPGIGARLLRHCRRDWDFQFNDSPSRLTSSKPVASALIAIGGSGRLPLFHCTLSSLRGQDFGELEIVVVEQGSEAFLRDSLPDDVIYIHDPTEEGAAFNKSRALNIAAHQAQGEYLMIHDGDFVVPTSYVGSIVEVLKKTDAVHPCRLIFYLDESTTRTLIADRDLNAAHGIASVVQNNPTPIGVRKSTYWDIGGHDESFVGWGGEDLEFLSRLRSRNVSEGGWMPVVHLWHPVASQKVGHRNQAHQDELLSVSPEQRIERLRQGQSASYL